VNPRLSIQETYWPEGICFGCGPSNEQGLHIKSYPRGEEIFGEWTPEAHHQAFPGILNGGIIGTLLDCHSAAASWWALSDEGREPGSNLVTAEYTIKLLRPTPVDRPLTLLARALEVKGRRVRIAARIEVDGEATAECEGTFVRPRNQV
jgi:acyl-coenzyme A thioesterase PaaI-like protein